MNSRRNKLSSDRSKLVNAASAVLQDLEPRTHMAAQPLAVTVSHNVLNITGTNGNDSIAVMQAGGRWTISNGAWKKVVMGNFTGVSINALAGNDAVVIRTSNAVDATLSGGVGNDTLVSGNGDDLLIGGAGNDYELGMGGDDWIYGSAGNDRIDGGAGNDQLYGGAGNDIVLGGLGDDVIVTLGGGDFDTVAGNAGEDSFWVDDDSTERIADVSRNEISDSTVHRVDHFESTFGDSVSKELNGQDLDDPYITSDATSYDNFGDNALFSSKGPAIGDVNQGAVGDCYFLAQLASYAMTNPQIIHQAVVDLGDGTFAVRFSNGGHDSFYRVDGDLPVNASGDLAYANFGAEDSVWVAVMEKAWTFARKGDGQYSSIESGTTRETANALGHDATLSDVPTSANSLFNQISAAINQGLSVTVGTSHTQPANSPMVEGHAYTVIGVVTDASGSRWLIVRNPWGIDGYSSRDGTDDGYVAITGQEAIQTLNTLVIAQV